MFDKTQPDLTDLRIFERGGERVYEMTIPNLGFGGIFKWSPDGKYVAFTKSQRQAEDDGRIYTTLAYVNLTDGEVFDLCVSNSQEFYWPPDSTKIVTERADTSSENAGNWEYGLSVVNIITGDVYQWYETSSPNFLKGWAVHNIRTMSI